jgi:hypothetical protein
MLHAQIAMGKGRLRIKIVVITGHVSVVKEPVK